MLVKAKQTIAGNWKLNKTIEEALDLASQVASVVESAKNTEVILSPPFTALSTVSQVVSPYSIHLAAQNIFWEDVGAFTGEISGLLVKNMCQYVILGHSERRQYFGETGEEINKKMLAAFRHKLVPILCIGETLTQNEAGETASLIFEQLRLALQNVCLTSGLDLVIAYEPVWAIGTGKPADPHLINDIAENIIHPFLTSFFLEITFQGKCVFFMGDQ